jgi:ferredoxin
LHLEAPDQESFARAVCDIYELRPPDLNIMDALTGIEGNGPCHGGHLRKVDSILASTDALALDSIMARMMGILPDNLFVQKEAAARGFGNMAEDAIEIAGSFLPIADFKMPITFRPELMTEGDVHDLLDLYPADMMNTRISIKPQRNKEKCSLCGECAENCPAGALTTDPEFKISGNCIACFCCVELCNQGALEVPGVDAFQRY